MTKSINISLLVNLALLVYSIGGHGVNVCLALHLRTDPFLEKVEGVQSQHFIHPRYHLVLLPPEFLQIFCFGLKNQFLSFLPGLLEFSDH